MPKVSSQSYIAVFDEFTKALKGIPTKVRITITGRLANLEHQLMKDDIEFFLWRKGCNSVVVEYLKPSLPTLQVDISWEDE